MICMYPSSLRVLSCLTAPHLASVQKGASCLGHRTDALGQPTQQRWVRRAGCPFLALYIFPFLLMTGSQTKQCPYCGEDVHADAVKCKHCHEYFDAALRQARSEKPWNPGIAALLSFFIPGAGQIYKGDVVRGLVLFFLTALGYFVFVLPGIALHIYAVYSAYSAPAPRDRTEPNQKTRKAQKPGTAA